MSELEMKTEAEVEDFTDELSDEAIDQAEGACTTLHPANWSSGCFIR